MLELGCVVIILVSIVIMSIMMLFVMRYEMRMVGFVMLIVWFELMNRLVLIVLLSFIIEI